MDDLKSNTHHFEGRSFKTLKETKEESNERLEELEKNLQLTHVLTAFSKSCFDNLEDLRSFNGMKKTRKLRSIDQKNLDDSALRLLSKERLNYDVNSFNFVCNSLIAFLPCILVHFKPDS